MSRPGGAGPPFPVRLSPNLVENDVYDCFMMQVGSYGGKLVTIAPGEANFSWYEEMRRRNTLLNQ